jgi:pimeloyl-ACP methyl ester carboxylesterase
MEPALYNRSVAIVRASSLVLIVWLMLAAGCTRMPVSDRAPIKASSVAELQGYLLSHKADLDLFRLRGPFAVTEHTNHELRLSNTERIRADLYLSATPGKVPLLIFLHGYDSSKEAHAYQAMHAASWGMHAVTVQLAKQGPWSTNGRTLARIAGLIHRSPGVIDERVDPNKIILVGHSFGAAAVAVALGEGAPAAGAIFLDPAAIGQNLPKSLQQIAKPVMVLGADAAVSSTRNRDYFYHFVRGGISEVSIRDATHEDAQYPSEAALQNFGFDSHTTEAHQITFVAAITSAALSLSTTGTFDYAWTSFDTALGNGKLFNARKK